MRHPLRHSLMFRAACTVLKYFLLFVFGFSTVCVLSTALGWFAIAEALLTALGMHLLRLAVLVFCFLAIAIIVESLR